MKKFILLLGTFISVSALAADIEAGKEIALAQCAACHGETGIAPSGAFPNIAGQHDDYIVHALTSYKNGDRKGGNAALMVGMVTSLTEDDFKNLAAYYSSFDGLFTPKQNILAE